MRFKHMLLVALGGLAWATAFSLAPLDTPRLPVLADIAPAVSVRAETIQAPPQAASGYAGDDTCTACHETEGKTLPSSLHGKAVDSRTPAAKPNQACETCNGPG